MNLIDNSGKALARAAPALKTSATSEGYAAHCTKSSNQARVRELTRRFDAEIALFREALPGFGLKLVVLPPFENGHRGRISVSAWRRSDAGARIYGAANASDALMQLLGGKADEDRDKYFHLYY